MPKLFLIENQEASIEFPFSKETSLHENILEMLFKHKEKICYKFSDICGTFLIDHLAINIIDPNNRIVIFSTTPSVEYNLISQDLWKYDKSFSVSYQANNRFYSWEKAYEKKYFEKLKLTKQINHGFSFGFNLSKKIKSFQFIYSFATRHQHSDLLEYYREHINELFIMGDYCYKAVSETYESQFGKIITTTEINKNQIRSFSPFIKLISSKK